jgi:geranylgeranyl diphosphate synthase type II
VGGQVDDLAAEFAPGDLAGLERIHRRKTGALFRVALRLGGIVAELDDEQLPPLDTYGKCLGLAFQIVDDLLDVRGDAADMGKRVAKDSHHGKLTFPALLGVPASRDRADQLIAQACAAVAPFGPRALPLDRLARFVLQRNR